MGDNNRNLKRMVKIYKPNGFDWMNFALTRRNPYNFHHIISRRNGGEDLVSNGAILTRRAHDLLHILEFACPSAFDDLQEIFMCINESHKPPTNEIMNEIDDILYLIFHEEHYEFIIDVDLSEYSNLYYRQSTKDKVKRK